MKRIITIILMLLLISIGISQEAKIDSVAIMAEMDIEAKKWNDAEAMIVKLEASKITYAYAWNVLAKMLVPKVEEQVVEEENKE